MQPKSVENKEVVHSRHSQDGHPLLLPQHAGSCTPQAAQHPAPASGSWAAASPAPNVSVRVAPKLAVSRVAEEREQEKQGRADVRPPDHAGHCFGVHGVGGEEQAGEKAPRSPAEQRAAQGCDEGRNQAVQQDIQQVVAPGLEAVNGVVETEGEGAEGTERFVAAAVGEQGAPEVVVQDVGPWSVWEEILVCLDGSTEKLIKKKII